MIGRIFTLRTYTRTFSVCLYGVLRIESRFAKLELQLASTFITIACLPVKTASPPCSDIKATRATLLL